MIKNLALPNRYQAILRRFSESFRTQRWQWVAGICAFTLINGYIIYRLVREWPAIASFNWSHITPIPLIIAAIVQFSGLLLLIGAWSLILHHYGYRIPYRRHVKIYTMANLARKLPGGIGVDLLSRIYMYDQFQVDRVRISFATLIEPVMFGISATIVTIVSLILSGEHSTFINPIIPIAALIIFLIFIPSPLFRKLLTRISKVPPEQQQLRWHHLLHWVAINTVTVTLGGVVLYFFCQGFGITEVTSLPMMIQYWAIAVMSGVLAAWLPIDIGATSSVTILALATIMPMPQAILLLVAWRVWNTLSELMWGGIGFLL